MKKDVIKFLAQRTVQKGKVNSQIAEWALQNLRKSELKTFLFFLKKYAREQTVVVHTSRLPTESVTIRLKKLFPDKIIEFQESPMLGAGILIQDNDTSIHMNVAHFIESVILQMKTTL